MQRLKHHRVLALVLLIGVTFQLVPIFFSGVSTSRGVEFYGVNGFDGVLHLAYIQSIVRHFPPLEPGAYPVPIENYHYWSDLIIAEIYRLFRVPIIHLYFHYFPILISLLTGFIALCVIHIFGGSRKMMMWFVFFLYFAGDGAYIVYYYLHHQLSFHTPAIDNGVTLFLNMPNALARSIFLGSFVLLQLWISSRNIVAGIVMIFLFSVLFGIKVYFGIFVTVGFLSLLLFQAISYLTRSKKLTIPLVITEMKHYMLLIGLFVFLTAAIFLPPNKSAGGLGYYPLEWPKSLLGEQSLNMKNWWLERQVFEQAHNTFRLLLLDSIAIIITIISVYGTRLIGFIPTRSLLTFFGKEKVVFLFPPLLLFQWLGLFTLQESGGFNVFNFFVVSVVALSLFSAVHLSTRRLSRYIVLLILLFVVGLSVPRSVYELKEYIAKYATNSDTMKVSDDELEALSYIEQNTPKNSVIQSDLQNTYDEKAPYVAFFADRYTFLSGEGFLNSHNQSTVEKRTALIKAFENKRGIRNSLKELGIQYVYVLKKNEALIASVKYEDTLPVVFENRSTLVIKIE